MVEEKHCNGLEMVVMLLRIGNYLTLETKHTAFIRLKLMSLNRSFISDMMTSNTAKYCGVHNGMKLVIQ